MITTTSEPGTRTWSSQRLVVPDVLRGFAIVAMLFAHAAPFLPDAPTFVTFPVTQLNDVASPLFALVMGMSAQLVWQRSVQAGVALRQQAIRGVFLIALGFWMTTWGSWVAIILAYLGVLLLVGVPMLLLRGRDVIIGTTALLVASQPLLERAREAMIEAYAQPFPIREFAEIVFLGASYRVVNLLPFFLLGGILLRHGFKRDRMLVGVALVAVAAYVGSCAMSRLPMLHPESGDYLDTLHDVGLVFAVYVLVVLAATVRASRAARFWGVVIEPLRASGQVALSLYLLHVAVIALWIAQSGPVIDNPFAGWLIVAPGMILGGWLWWRFVGTGPVEWIMGWFTGRRKPLRRVSPY